MTAVPSWDLVDPRHTDAELVGASMAGDRAAFAQIYDRYADRLHDFCVGMLRDSTLPPTASRRRSVSPRPAYPN